MQTAIEPRVRRRVPCTINVAGGQHRALVLNLSRSGLFVQTSLPADPGTPIAIDLSGPRGDESIAVSGTVVWRRRISPRMSSTNQSGMGVRLDAPPMAWSELVGDAPVVTATAPSAAHIEYSVRLAQTGSPRTRRLVVRGGCEQEARDKAISEVGADWEILELSIR